MADNNNGIIATVVLPAIRSWAKGLFAKKDDLPTKTSDLNNDSNFASDANYVHTDNNFTAELKSKLEGLAADGEKNAIETVKRNGVALAITDEAVDIAVPVNTSDLTNDSGYQNSTQVQEAIESAISTQYTAAPSATLATLPAPAKAVLGFIYNMSEDFTTTEDFVEGAGKAVKAGTNVVVVNAGTKSSPSYKFDVQALAIDTSNFATKDEIETLTLAEATAILNASE